MDIATFMVAPLAPASEQLPLFHRAVEKAVSTRDEHIENMVFQSMFTLLMAWCHRIRDVITPAQAVASVQWLEDNAGMVMSEPTLLAWIAHPKGTDTATVKDAIEAAGDGTNLLLIMLLLVCGVVAHVAEGDTEWLRQFDVADLSTD